MLSILIPVYRVDVRPLIADLHSQGIACGIPFEIYVLDDASGEPYAAQNAQVQALPHVRYRILSANVGRSAIRNRLAEGARFPYLLFIDCDHRVTRADFLTNYCTNLNPGTVLCGGTAYQAHPPKPNYRFHWRYGRAREVRPATLRQQQPYHAFKPNNFVVPKDIFLAILFEEGLRRYGHEDTLFGMELRTRDIQVRHLDNPLEHAGLEEGRVFLEKSKRALENLSALRQHGRLIDTRLTRLVDKLERRNMTGVVCSLIQPLLPWLERKLPEGQLAMRWLDIYKLGYFLELLNKKG